MKRAILALVLLCVCCASAQTGGESVEQINQKLVAAYQAKKFAEADKLAQQALEISIVNYGADNALTAGAYTNLALVRRERKKYEDSVENLQKALVIYQKVPDFKKGDLIAVYEALALSQSLAGRKKEAEENYLKASDLTARTFGQESKEVFASTLSLANFYAVQGDFDKADEAYLKSYGSAVKNWGKNGAEVGRVDDNRACLVTVNTSVEKRAERERQFAEAKKRMFGIEQGNLLNGELARPQFPRTVSHPVNQKVVVRVRIDEKGKVIDAQSVCGIQPFAKATEAAARTTTFNPVLIGNAPAPATGYIIYWYRTEIRRMRMPGVVF